MNAVLVTRFFVTIITVTCANAVVRRSEGRGGFLTMFCFTVEHVVKHKLRKILRRIIFIYFLLFLFAIAPKQPIKVQGNIGAAWSNGIIPYYLDSRDYDHVIAMRLRMTMNMLEGVSCIRFKPIIGLPESNTTWLYIANPKKERECIHMPLFEYSGKVNLVLGLDCLSEEQVLHTLMHGIGFKDEVTHPQRDQYIRVLWDNIQPVYQRYFRVQADDGFLAEYDPMSVMQFHDRAFSLNGHATIAPLISGLIINPSKGLSQLDTMKLRMLFGHECKKRNVDDLLDMCKAVMHQKQIESDSPDPSESGNDKNGAKMEIGENNRNSNQTDNNPQKNDDENNNDNNNKNMSANEEENNDDGQDKDEETRLNIIVET